MGGEGAVRQCAACDRSVHDLSALTEPEAEALLAGPTKPCVRFARRFDGSVIFKAAAVLLAASAPAFALAASPSPPLAVSAEAPLPAGTLRVTVYHGDPGNAFDGVFVELRRADRPNMKPIVHITDADGVVVFTKLRAGRWVWTAQKDGRYGPNSGTVELDGVAGERVETTLSLSVDYLTGILEDGW
jgi:hypothetical protein